MDQRPQFPLRPFIGGLAVLLLTIFTLFQSGANVVDANTSVANVATLTTWVDAIDSRYDFSKINQVSNTSDTTGLDSIGKMPVDDDMLGASCSWTSAATYPIPILDSAVTRVGSNIYSFGGLGSNTRIAAAYRFDGTTWTQILSLPVALGFPAAVNDGTNIYILGGAGSGGVSQNTLYRYNVASNTYTTLQPFSTGTWNHAAIYLNGKIYKFTGSIANAVSTNVLEIYDVASNTWTVGSNYPITASFVGAFSQGNFIYAAGGIDVAASTPSLKTYRYDPGANTWNDAAIADLPATRWGAASTFYNSSGVLAGGTVAGTSSVSVISWNSVNNTWSSLPDMLGDRFRMNGAVLNGSFHVVGGASIALPGFEGTNNNQKLTCDSPGTIQFRFDGVGVFEGNFSVGIEVTRTGGSSGVATVQFQSFSGSATAGLDYVSPSGPPLSWGDGDSSTKTFLLQILNDSLLEGDENLTLQLFNPTGATLGVPSTQNFTIYDDEQQGTVSISDVTQAEGNGPGTTPFTFNVTLSRTGPGSVFVEYQTADGTATVANGDYNPISRTFLAFNQGGPTTIPVTVAVIGDTTFEPNENFFVNLRQGFGSNFTFTDSQGMGTIINDDVASGAIQFSSSTYVVSENSVIATITATRTGGSVGAVSAQYSTIAGTAVGGTGCLAGVDYVNTGGTLNFAAGQTSQTFNVTICNDFVYELNETLTLILSNPTGGATLGSPTAAVLTIVDDDPVPALSINNIAHLEGNGPGATSFTFTVSSNVVSSVNSTFNFATSDGSASASTGDYAAIPSAFGVIPAGTTTTQITVLVNGDPVAEPNETFFVNLTGANNATIASGTGTGTIVNDDPVACTPIQINFGESYSGNLNNASCVIGGNKTDLYTFSGTAGRQIAMTMTSGDFFTRIELFDPQGAPIQQAGGSPTQRNSRLPDTGYFPLSANGIYTVRAIGSSGESGGYTLSLYQAPVVTCTYSLSSLRTNVASTGGTFYFDVITQPGCPPVAAPAATGTIYNSVSYIGGRVTFTVLANPNPDDRQDTITIADRTHTVYQYGTAAPSNNNFAFAQVLTGINSPVNAPIIGNNTAANAENNEPAHAGNTAVKSVWYTWTPPSGAAGLYSFSAAGSSFDTVMAIYACPAFGGCSLPNLIPVGSNDDTTFFDKTSKVNFRANFGTQYMIAIDGKNGASGTIQLSWRPYERLFRLYLQNYNGNQSTFSPDSIIATNGIINKTPTLVAQGVYEFSLPADGTTYVVTITGPTGIVWDPNNIQLNPSSGVLDELMRGPAIGLQNSVSNSQNQTPRYIYGYIQNITAQEIASLSVFIGSSRGPNPRDATACTPLGSVILSSIPYATYQCLSQPQTLNDIVPNMANKKFVISVRSFENPIDTTERGTLSTAFVASNSPTYNISGCVLAGGQGTVVELSYTPTGNLVPISLGTRTTDSLGSYMFRNFSPNTYRVKANREGYVFSIPPSIDLQAPGATGIDISAESLCTYTPVSLSTLPVGGGPNQFTVSASEPTCAWSAASDVSWITINSGAIVGTGPVHFTAEPNAGPGRIGSIRVAGRADPVYVQQASSNPTFASVSGRVTTPDGRGLRNAVVTIIDSNGVRQTATTSSFGLFTFGNIETGRVYTLTATSKRYRFTPRTLQITGNASNVDFVGLE